MTYESKRFEVAKRVVRTLLKNLDYSELYEDFLQEGISEEEFKLESEKYKDKIHKSHNVTKRRTKDLYYFIFGDHCCPLIG